MRLTALTLARYGIFESQSIVFDPTPGRINLLVAANGAGKSIIRQAFCDLLFGIHGQSPMGFRFGYNGMKVTAEAVGPDGTAFALARRKGQGQTLAAANGAALDNATLVRLLGSTDRALLERLFALDTRRLRDGAAELLASGGTLADALVAAAGGLSQARQLRRSLEEARDELAPLRRTATRPFYVALDRFNAAGKQFRSAAIKPEMREKQESDLEDLQRERLRLNDIAAEASRNIARLQRIRLVAGPLATHDEAALWLSNHPDAPILPPDTRQRLADVRAALFNARQLFEQETRNCRALSEQIAAIEIDAVLLEQADAIGHLTERAPVARQAASDIPRRETELAATTQRIADLLRRLGLSLSVEQAADAIPPQPAVLRARRLFGTYATLQAALERLPGEIAAPKREIAEAKAAIEDLPAAEDMAELNRLLREIRAEGEPGHRAEEAARAVAEKQALSEAALSRAPGWQLGKDALIALAPQSTDVYARLAAAVDDARLALEKTTDDVKRLQAAMQEDERRLSQIAAGTPMPDHATIAAARERRDRGWRLIYRHAFTAEPPTADQVEAWAGEIPLPLAYERSVAAADELADRRNQESERLARAAELRRRIAESQAEIANAETARAAAEADFVQQTAAWQRACAPLQFSAPPHPNEVADLLSTRDRLIAAASDLMSVHAAQASLSLRHANWRDRLAAALGFPPQPAAHLTGLLLQADDHIATATRAEKERAAHLAILAATQKTLDAREAEYQEAQRRLEKFQADWAATQRELARPAAEDPETTIGILDLINDLDKQHEAARVAHGRLREMHEELAGFRAQARALQPLAPDLASDDEFAISAELRRRLAGQQSLDQQRKTLATQLEIAEAAVTRQTEQNTRCKQALDALLDHIGAGTVEAAEGRILAAEERAKCEASLARARDELRQNGDGFSLEQLRAEAAEIAIDDVVGQINGLDSQRKEATGAAQEIAGRFAELRARMAREAEETGAQAAAAGQQAAIATIDHVLDEAALMHLASLMLQSSLEQVAAAGTSALLARIGALFSILTDGAYLRVEAEDPGDGSARLVAVEKDFPDEHKKIDELSEGTRDQLFLALRLAAIEDHVAAAPPLPFLGDDILQSFDDDRALAAMRALVALSNRVQVIVLSHHRHLLALARPLPPDQVHVCQITPS